MIQEMSLLNRKAHKRHKRSPSFHQKQVRFFVVLLSLLAMLFITGLIWLISQGPASRPLFHSH
jgi:hypothetical protein